jgi:hypothetical protein
MCFVPQWRATFYLSSGQMAPHPRRFSEPTFWPSGTTNHGKSIANRDFPTFSRTCIFFLLILSLLWSSLFCLSLLWLFPSAFPSLHIVGSLTSKLPSIINTECVHVHQHNVDSNLPWIVWRGHLDKNHHFNHRTCSEFLPGKKVWVKNPD